MYIENIIERYGSAVYSFALMRLKNPDDAADVYQNVFLKLFEKKPHFLSEAQLKSWLMKTTFNFSADILRKKIRECELTDDIATKDKEYDGFFDIIEKLPEKYRDAVYLHYGEDMKISDIAKVLGLTAGGVKARLSRARQMLKEDILNENK